MEAERGQRNVLTKLQKQHQKLNLIPGEVHFSLSADLSGVQVILSCNKLGDILDCSVHNVSSSLKTTQDKTTATAR